MTMFVDQSRRRRVVRPERSKPSSKVDRMKSLRKLSRPDVCAKTRIGWRLPPLNLKAAMVPQLGMDRLVEVTSEHYYGPTTVCAIQEFIRLDAS